MANIQTPPPNPHQESIDKLVNRVLPIVRAMPFAQNRREPWLGNATVDKAVIATIETCFVLADQDRVTEQQPQPATMEVPADTPVLETQSEVVSPAVHVVDSGEVATKPEDN